MQMQYILKTPQSFSPDKKYPLIAYLHGAGSRGNTTEVLQNAVIFKYAERQKDFPAVILAPLCSADTWFDVFEQLAIYLNTVKLTETAGATGAAIRLSKDGKFLYCSVRGENALYVLRADGANLTAEQKTDCGGDSPRDFHVIEDKFLICCNENSDNVTVFSLRNDVMTAKIAEAKLPKPLCVVT